MSREIRPLSDEQQAKHDLAKATANSAENLAKLNHGNSKPIEAYPQKDVPEHIVTGQE
jgi:hypothetical protein